MANENQLVSQLSFNIGGATAAWAGTEVNQVALPDSIETVSVTTTGTGTLDDLQVFGNAVADAVGQAAVDKYGSQMTWEVQGVYATPGTNWSLRIDVALINETNPLDVGPAGFVTGSVPCAVAIRGAAFTGVDSMSGNSQTNFNSSYATVGRAYVTPVPSNGGLPNTLAAQQLWQGIGGTWVNS